MITYLKSHSKAIGFNFWPRAHGLEPGWSADVSFDLHLWPLISLQPLDQNQCLVSHLKDLFHIYLEIKVQGFWMTFKVCNYGSKYPYLLHKMGFAYSQFGNTVPTYFWHLMNYLPNSSCQRNFCMSHNSKRTR